MLLEIEGHIMDEVHIQLHQRHQFVVVHFQAGEIVHPIIDGNIAAFGYPHSELLRILDSNPVLGASGIGAACNLAEQAQFLNGLGTLVGVESRQFKGSSEISAALQMLCLLHIATSVVPEALVILRLTGRNQFFVLTHNKNPP